ncbi:MAG TPA: ATP-dependent DNA helicase RecG [Bacteroidales bacterium]|nr:ATP-dependent DNA helicase RecG [Bacteroidales bacterium]
MGQFDNIDIKFLHGVGPNRVKLLKSELDIQTFDDLIHFYPYKYIDRSRFYLIREIDSDQTFVQIKGTFIDFSIEGTGKTQRLKGVFSDGYNTIDVMWFAGIKYIREQIKTGVEYVLFGKPGVYNHMYNFSHPELELLSKFRQRSYSGLEPYYNTTGKMKNSRLTSKVLKDIEAGAMQIVRDYKITEHLPQAMLERLHLMSLTESILNIHFPANIDLLNKARQRLKFEELFYLELMLLRQCHQREQGSTGLVVRSVGHYFNTFYFSHLPFPLTGAQKRVIREIYDDMRSGRQMNRLLQGDVGSGKTLVALICCLIAVDNGYQTCIMAPTEVLANQHLESLMQMTRDLGINIRLLTGSTTKKQREIIHQQLTDGTLNILIGTHALLEDNVKFRNLGLAIIDEQHRFGVAQRAKLWTKNTLPPHVLVMTATPIPRTLAMTVYGDLRVSVIDEMPPGRKPVKTVHRYLSQRLQIYDFLKQQIALGRQIYFVFPLIDENEKMDLASLEAGYEEIKLAFHEYTVCMVHGRMTAAVKDANMALFASGKAKIMVATTVIEVGVNVPNASVMVIENAERFGLSQLHQLRGRVGRGAEQSYCILLTGVKLSKDTKKRMDIMVRTNDGFEIADADLQLRGPGDMEGTQQSGIPFELKIANLVTDQALIELARHEAQQILDDDPELTKNENFIFAKNLQAMKSQVHNWSEIS